MFLQVNGFTSGIQFAKFLKKKTNRMLSNHFLKSVSCLRNWRMKVGEERTNR